MPTRQLLKRQLYVCCLFNCYKVLCSDAQIMTAHKIKWPPWWSWPTAFLWLINSRGSFGCITMTWILCKDMRALSVMRFLCHTYIHTYLNIVQTMTWIFIVQRYGSSSSDEVHTFLCHTYTYIRARWIFRLGEFGPKG